jgi:hypothetical protein
MYVMCGLQATFPLSPVVIWFDPPYKTFLYPTAMCCTVYPTIVRVCHCMPILRNTGFERCISCVPQEIFVSGVGVMCWAAIHPHVRELAGAYC